MSKPFRFRLERVRELRAHAEDRAREELAASLGAQLRGEAMLRAATHRWPGGSPTAATCLLAAAGRA
ncbi:MAG: hypothetical protein R2736_00460 [Solirubrobacterales bacterium]